MNKLLLDMNDFKRLSDHFNEYDSEVDALQLMDSYVNLLRISPSYGPDEVSSATSGALVALRDLIAERCGVQGEIVQVSFEDFVDRERRDNDAALAAHIFGERSK